MQPNFYGVNIDTPLSTHDGDLNWHNTPLGRLHAVNDQIYLDYLQGRSLLASYAWRVVDAYFTNEDSTITYFRAYGLEGEPLPWATFGVNFGGCPQISGGFTYPPKHGNNYYIPVENKFHTPNAGGYKVEVLDRNYPSEALAFGMHKSGPQHQCLIVSFRLFPLGPGYPRDTDWKNASLVY